jgi:hypothetical protein
VAGSRKPQEQKYDSGPKCGADGQGKRQSQKSVATMALHRIATDRFATDHCIVGFDDTRA